MRRVLYTLIIFLFLTNCNDNEEGPDDYINGEPAVTEIGIPLENAVTAEIGSSGGSLSSADGMLAVTVPKGAVDANTTFSVQPITNFCPGGMAAFRLLPDGLTFTTSVMLTFHYTDEDIAGTSPEFLGIAYQAEDRIWYTLPVEVDASAKTITTAVKHFTDWAVLSRLIIGTIPSIAEVKVTETLDLQLIGQEDLPPLPPSSSGNPIATSPSPDEDELPALPNPVPFKAVWYVNGVLNGNANVGTISTFAADQQFVEYKAPETVPANNPVLISAELIGFRFWDRVNRRMKTFNKVILLKRVLIKPDEYNFMLELQIRHDKACGLAGQQYTDRVEMDIKVKDDVVTVSNIENHPAAISPAEVQFPGTECTITCVPGPTGVVNVTNVEGNVAPGADERSRLYLLLDSKGATTYDYTMECPDADTFFTPYTSFDTSYSVDFLLKDSAQINDYGVVGYWVKLTPR